MTLLLPHGAFKIVLQKGLTVDFEKISGLGLFGKSGAGKTTTLLSWLNSWQVAPRFTWWTVEQAGLFPNVLQRASGVSDVHFMLGYVVAQMEQREDFLGKEHVRRRLEAGLARWDLPLVVAIVELRAIVASAQARKSRADRFASDNAQRSLSGVILVVASQFASVDAIPNADKFTTFGKILPQLCAWLNWCECFPTSSPGAPALVSLKALFM